MWNYSNIINIVQGKASPTGLSAISPETCNTTKLIRRHLDVTDLVSAVTGDAKL